MYPPSYCCPAKSVMTGLLVAKRPSMGGEKIKAEYFEALVNAELIDS